MRNLLFRTAITLFAMVAFIMPAAALQVRELGWPDLIQKVEFEDPFKALTSEQLGDLGIVARMRVLQDRNHKAITASMRQEAQAAERSLIAAGIDIDGLLARREEIRELRKQRAHSVVDDLHGQQVRMPGYALPLEYSGKKITEFLLVPWVGACIHTPPPPPNQIVYVKLKEGFRLDGRFSPVWVTGEVTVGIATKNLYLVDGASDIPIGYSMSATLIEHYAK